MKQPIGNVIQNTVRGTRNLINNVRSGIGRLSFSRRPNVTATPQVNQNTSVSGSMSGSPITTRFVPAKNVITQKELSDMVSNNMFYHNHVVSGNSTYPVVDSNWIPMGVQRSLYSKYFKLKELKRAQDDLSKGNLFLDHEGAARRDGDRVLTEADFQNVKPATEVLGPKVFDTNDKGYGVYSDTNPNPQAQFAGESFLGSIDADEAHILAMGGDDIARRIMKNGSPRVLFRRYERMHPLKQQELNYAATNRQRMPRFSSIRVTNNTTGSATNVPFMLQYGNQLYYALHGRKVPVYSGAGAQGPRYSPSRHSIFMYNADEYAKDLKKFSEYKTQDPSYDFRLSVSNDAPLLARTTLDDINSSSTKPIYTYSPFTNYVGQTLDTGTLFHELMHSEMGNFTFDPRTSAFDIVDFINAKKYIPDQTFSKLFKDSGIVAPNDGYATQRASELSRAYAMMKDVIVNSIRHRVETLAPKKIPGWFEKSPEERANIIADVTLDLSENAKLANHIMRGWGFEGQDIRIPMSYIKINDPTYMYELLRAADGIRKTRIPANKSVLNKLIDTTKKMFPYAVAERKQRLLEQLSKNIDITDKAALINVDAKAERMAAKQVAKEQYRELFKKTWIQTAPAIAATAATPYLYSRLTSDDQYIN